MDRHHASAAPRAGHAVTLSAGRALLAALDQAYDRRSWHGTNLKGSLRGVRAAEAAWRPAQDRHSIWEIALHCAYWKYAVRRRLLGEKRGGFPRQGSDWPAADGNDERQWRRDLRLLDDTHRTMRQAIAGLSAAQLERTPAGSKVDNLSLVTGIIAHDLHHAGQIQLLKRLGASGAGGHAGGGRR